MTRRYGDRVKHWITLNEPWCSAFLGYVIGIHAPGHRNLQEGLQVMHHLLLAHGLAMPVIRANVPDAQAGICLNPTTFYPYGDSQEDLDAAQREDGLRNRVWFDPLAGRGYPDDMVDLFREIWPEIGQNDMAIIAAPTDFMGVNFYNPDYVEASPEPPLYSRGVKPANLPRTAMDWIIEPSGLTDTVTRIQTDYGDVWKTQYIFENGAAFDDRLLHGEVDDRKRARYIHDHLVAAAQGDRQRRAGKGVFRLVAAGQLRMGGGVQPPVRHHLCRLQDAGADDQTVGQVVRRGGCGERADRAGLGLVGLEWFRLQ